MGQLVSVAQAAYLVRRDQRSLRWHIANGSLRAVAGEDGHMQVDVDDLGRVRGWRLDSLRLAELTAQAGRAPDAIAQRLASLERESASLRAEVRELRGRVRALEGRAPLPFLASASAPDGSSADGGGMIPSLDASKATGGQRSASGGVLGAPGLADDVRGVDSVSPRGPLPPGLVSLAGFAKLHSIRQQTAVNAADAGRLPTHQSVWVTEHGKVQRALDATGRREFFRLYHEWPDFRPCGECPH